MNLRTSAPELYKGIVEHQNYGSPKVPFFLFPGISLGVTHSLKFQKSVFFIFRKSGKNKKQVFFYFSQE